MYVYTGSYPQTPNCFPNTFAYHHLVISDSPLEDISQYFFKLTELAHDMMSGSLDHETPILQSQEAKKKNKSEWLDTTGKVYQKGQGSMFIHCSQGLALSLSLLCFLFVCTYVRQYSDHIYIYYVIYVYDLYVSQGCLGPLRWPQPC